VTIYEPERRGGYEDDDDCNSDEHDAV